MRDAYSLSDFLKALNAWDRHKEKYLENLRKANAEEPSKETMVGYRSVWVEGFLEAIENVRENETTS